MPEVVVSRRCSIPSRLVVAAVLVALIPMGLARAAVGTHRTPVKKKPKPVCHLVVGPKNQDPNFATGAPADPSLIITSADVATSSTTLTWAVRVQKLTTGFDPSAFGGREWSFSFVVNGITVSSIVSASPTGTVTASEAGAKATLDAAHNQVLFSVPLKTLANDYRTRVVKRVTVLNSLSAQTYNGAFLQSTPQGPVNVVVDQGGGGVKATSTRTYLAGTRSCVKVGS